VIQVGIMKRVQARTQVSSFYFICVAKLLNFFQVVSIVVGFVKRIQVPLLEVFAVLVANTFITVVSWHQNLLIQLAQSIR
jgi:hypothetical protein